MAVTKLIKPVYDLLNVADNILTDDVFSQTRTLGDKHEYNLA